MIKKEAKALLFQIALALIAVLAISFSANLITLFIFYEILTFTTYPLIKFYESEESKKAAKNYLYILVGSSFLFFFPALIINYFYVGNLDFKIQTTSIPSSISLLLLVLYLFGVAKTAIMPLHSWLIKSMVAPIPVSALLHAVAVVKSGIFAILKIIIFNIGLANIDNNGSLFIAIFASITIILASIYAKKQTNLKALLAYSTVSQLSYSILITSMMNNNAFNAAFLQMITHAFAKIGLFFCAGYFYLATNIVDIKPLGAIGRKMPLVTICFTICALSIIGIAPLIGFFSKFYMLSATYPINNIAIIVIFTIIISTCLTASYLLPIIYQFWWDEQSPTIFSKVKIYPLIFVSMLVSFGILFYKIFYKFREITIF